jgi:transcriptional regulator with XRE-family HTH domain
MNSINMDVKKMSKQFVINANVLRKENHLSYRGMARAVGVSDSTIRRMDGARKHGYGKGLQGYIPSLATVVKVASAAGVSPVELLTTRF